MRFGLKCVFFLAVVYRAILVSQGGPEPAELAKAALADALPLAQSAARREIETRLDGYCRNDPAACLADAARLTDLVSASGPDDTPSAPPHRRYGTPPHGALATQAR